MYISELKKKKNQTVWLIKYEVWASNTETMIERLRGADCVFVS